MTVASDFVAALVGLKSSRRRDKIERPAFSKPGGKATLNPRGAVQITGASSLSVKRDLTTNECLGRELMGVAVGIAELAIAWFKRFEAVLPWIAMR